METRQAILAHFIPKAVLKALTREAELAAPQGLVVAGMLGIRGFPFRVGRESRGKIVDRGSVCGTSAGGVRIGGNETGGTVSLRDGDEILVGADATPYRYTFIVCSED